MGPSSCIVKGGMLSYRRYLPTYLFHSSHYQNHAMVKPSGCTLLIIYGPMLQSICGVAIMPVVEKASCCRVVCEVTVDWVRVPAGQPLFVMSYGKVKNCTLPLRVILLDSFGHDRAAQQTFRNLTSGMRLVAILFSCHLNVSLRLSL